MDTILSMKGIRKEYPGVLALDSIDFDLKRGEVHCLVGENGAGKSTLVKILSGAISANSGTILINGNPASIHNPLDAQKAGIGIIYQDFKIVP
jgi:ribose transport system ATP-binding protein